MASEKAMLDAKVRVDLARQALLKEMRYHKLPKKIRAALATCDDAVQDLHMEWAKYEGQKALELYSNKKGGN